MAEILVVEDEEIINELIRRNLSLVGHHCERALDGEEAIEIAKAKKFDLIVLDIMLPKLDGFQVLQEVKGTPTIFLTAKKSVDDRIKGLFMGADDYLTKPFEMLELVARVEAVLRRTKKNEEEDVFVIDDMRIEYQSKRLFFRNQPVECTPKEFELMEVLIKNRNIALSREKLLELVWGYEYIGETRTVDVHIQKLRRKLGLENRIVTVYKTGYRLEV